MERLYIEGRRDGYTPKQCRESMTVGELIEALSQYDNDLLVYLDNDNGYTFGSIDLDGIRLRDDRFEDDEDYIEEE